MLEQVKDLRSEGDELYELLKTVDDSKWELPTPFKDRTVTWVVQHLHDADRWAHHSVTDPDGFRKWMAERQSGAREAAETLHGQDLVERWHSYFHQMCDVFDEADPALRAPWFGPDMGIRMMATARQMETWAHGQDIYDLLQQPRAPTDRIRNICHIGVRTYGWTFVNRSLPIPEPVPFVRLTAPSGAEWVWGEEQTEEVVEGSAVEFAHVVTQGRNIADVDLRVVGENAKSWMEIAQCFAGPPETPPAPGHRTW